eukprot:27193_1
MSSPALPPIAMNIVGSLHINLDGHNPQNNSNSLQKSLTPDTSIKVKELKITGLTPLTPIDYEDELDTYTPPPSINHLNQHPSFNTHHKPEFSMTATSCSLSNNNTMKTHLTIEPQDIATHESRRSTLSSLGFSPFDPMDITTIHPMEVNKALNMIQNPHLKTTNSFQQEHIAAFARQVDRRTSTASTASNSYLKSNAQQLVLQNRVNPSTDDNDQMPLRNVPCSEGCLRNICLNSDFWSNKYNIFRMIMLCVIVIFIIVCVLYAIGQLSRLELDDYMCDNEHMDIDSIHAYNKENGNVKGELLSCYTTEKGIINEAKLYEHKDIVYKAVFDVNVVNVAKMLSFIAIGVFLFILVLVVHCVKLWNDLRRFYFSAWLYIYWRQKRSKTSKSIYERCWSGCVYCITNNSCVKFYRKYFSADRIGWVFYLMLREIIEVFIQTMALLTYGGYNHGLDIQNDASNAYVMAEKPTYIIIFSIFLSMNCLTVGLIWSLYICCHDSFQGRYFNGIILMIDSIFDIFYSFFPLIIRNHFKQNQMKIDNLLFFSSFQSYSLIGFLAMIIPLLFLSTKMFTVLNFLSSKSRKDWRLLFDEKLWYKMQCELARIEPHKHDSLSQVEIKTNPLKSTQHALTIRHTIDERPEEEEAVSSRSLCSGPSYLQSPLPDRHFWPARFCIQVIRRGIVLCYGMILIIYGTFLIIYIARHFVGSHDICRELSLWNYCTHKVYPFFTQYPCQCRSFFMSQQDFVDSQTILMRHNIFATLFEHWYMLQMIVLHAPHDDGTMNVSITLHHVESRGLRIISIKNIHVNIMDESLFGIWKHTELFQIDNALSLSSDPLYQLKNVKYLSLIGSNMRSLESICHFDELKYLSLHNNTDLSTLPFECMLNTPLQYINLVHVNVFNVSLLLAAHARLKQYIHYFGDIGWNDMDLLQMPSNETQYYLQGTQLCIQYRNKTNQRKRIFDWIEQTNACHLPYPLALNQINRLNVCPPVKWMNGICDQQCNNEPMLFDGGDCTQYP